LTDQEVLNDLTPLFREIFRDDAITLKRETTAADVERWDSLTHIDMIMMVEAHFGIRVPTRVVAQMKAVGDLVHVIQSRLK
jgi:acyl carrier protein